MCLKNHLPVAGIHPYDGYSGELFFKIDFSITTYYDPVVDNQCKIPLRPIAEIREELYNRYGKELNEK